ncbi:hypothetical protein KYC5002_11705 [Archangium violaceum]|uniref:hypothetical protein n=1 Tax=Archangium violaceum TaxID=83451 RepID=UPI002B2BB13A|nr:hypothetical protein KYC5002_11705 [Archangium gephyra]
MSKSKIPVIEEDNLSLAWARMFLCLATRSDEELAPLVVSVTGFKDGEAMEDETVRNALDACLEATDRQCVNTVANTIFPQSVWLLTKGNRKEFYATYLENLPSYVAMALSKNGRGLYFARLIAFYTNPKTGKRLSYVPEDSEVDDGNQLEFIIENCRPGTRRTLFQASIFDPLRDHTRANQLGFPCLQHVSFTPDFKAKTLKLSAFYASQQGLDRAYGNFLGLCRLGAFIAHETGLTFERMTCYAGVEKMDKRPNQNVPEWVALKAAAQNLVDAAKSQTTT